MKQELMRPEVDAQDFVKFNYWDGGRKGLLSGEALYLDVKRMEMAYHDNNKRELELTKHVSLRQLNPFALLTLKATGTCQVTIPEWLYDLDCPGHYMRRMKHVAVSSPSVAGPYTSVTCTMSLLKSTLRKSPLTKDGEYTRQGSEDDRFVDYVGAVQSIVTSTGQNDSGMFETNLRDERFLPFEGAGAESTWKLDLPKDYPAFDYTTISDVILHIRYTARQGVDASKVKAALDDLFQHAN
jgi:Tc toxin complex TcA C-terminal TcB-binding domain